MIRRGIIISLLVCGLTLAGLGVVSLWEDIGGGGPLGSQRWVAAEIGDGHLRLTVAQRTDVAPTRAGFRLPLGWFGRVSFATGVNGAQWRYAVARVPVWMPVMLLFVPPASAFVRGPVLRSRRRRRNQCVHCGYDLTGSTSGVCSECGEAFRCGVCGCDLRETPDRPCPVCSRDGGLAAVSSQ